MKPIPLVLPLKAEEAAALADLIYQQVDAKPLTADSRQRFAARIPVLHLQTFTPFPGSLQKDPIHPSTYYIAVDAHAGGVAMPLLLRIAPATTPASGLFPGPLLIGRMRLTSGAEVVINAIPFGSADAAQIQTFAEQVDRDFLPRPQGAQSCISIATPDPARDAPVAFAAFRAILKSTGVNLASFCFAAGADADALAPFHDAAVWAIVWAAIRAGWREGYGLEAVVAAKEDAQATHAFTKFSAAGGSAEELHAHIVKVKAGQASWKNFDFEVAFPETRTPTTPEELTARVQAIKDRGIAVQSVAPWLELSDPGARKHIAALAEAARHVGVTLSFRSRGEERSSGQENYALLEEIGRLTGGRFHFRYFTKEALDAGRLRTLASRLLGKSIPT